MKLKFDETKILKIAGIATTVLGMGITIVDGIVADRNLNNKVSEKVAEAMQNFKVENLPFNKD